MAVNKDISPSLEDYLEAIHRIVEAKGAVRARDIAARLGVSRPSVTGQLKVLAEKGLANYAPYDVITLTAEGERVARRVDTRHKTLREFLVRVLRVQEDEADKAACSMEHGHTAPISRKLEKFVKQYNTSDKRR